MRHFITLISATSIVAVQLAVALPAAAAPGDRGGYGGGGRQMPQSRPAPTAKPAGSYNKPQRPEAKPAGGYNKPQTMPQRPQPGSYDKARPAGGYNRPVTRPVNTAGPNGRPGSASRPGSYDRPGPNKPGYGNPGYGNPGYGKPGKPNRPGNNNDITINNNNNINVSGNNRYPNGNRYPNANRYPVYRPPGGGYYRPPNGGYYGPPRPPYGGWGGGYYPPPRYYYNDGPSVGGILFGVAVTTSLLALLSAANQPDVVYVQGAPPPPLPVYQPPRNASGAPAAINVDLNALSSAQRPAASVCITEAARQIGATGGTEIRIGEIINVEEGNGGYRFQLGLIGVYPDETRTIPMYCRATSEKIVELTFG